MNILMVNKYLHPAGGAESYVFRLGGQLERCGHRVEYFGMEHPERCVSNSLGLYTRQMDFHGGRLTEQLTYPFQIIRSADAKRKMSAILDSFQPDVIHINNFNYQLTPSILEAAREYRSRRGGVRIILTAHDYQLVCPNHMLYRPNDGTVCERCLNGRFGGCVTGKCIHGSALRSVLGAAESYYWHGKGIYDVFDAVVCPSAFLKTRLDTNPTLAKKTVVMQNFAGNAPIQRFAKKDYVLYFGRFSVEKGIELLLEVCRRLPDIPFVFAGSGPMEDRLSGLPNVKNVGFQSGDALTRLVGEARFTVHPSIWYENCPFSVIESMMAGTPVLGADNGGITELLDGKDAGELFRPNDADALCKAVHSLWNDRERQRRYEEGCRKARFASLEEYTDSLLALYAENQPKGIV